MKAIKTAVCFSILLSFTAFADNNPETQQKTVPSDTQNSASVSGANAIPPADNSKEALSSESGDKQTLPSNSQHQQNEQPETQKSKNLSSDEISPLEAIDKQASPPSPSIQQKALPLSGSHELEISVIKLTQSLTKFIEAKSEPEDVPTKVVDFLSKLGVLIATMLGCYISYAGLRKVPWFKEHQELIATTLIAVSMLVLFYLLSGLVISTVYVLIAILILLIALVLAAAHLIKFIDEKYPDVRDNILAHFSQTSTDKSVQKLARQNVRSMYNWLSSIVFMQRLNGEIQLTLQGSFVTGFDNSIFEIEPDDRIVTHWEMVNDSILIPVKLNVRVSDSNSGVEANVVNIQSGLVVVRLNNELQFRTFSQEGFRLLAACLLQKQAEKMKKLLEEQQRFEADAAIFNSQYF